MFHLACVGLSELPATDVWFCPTCVRFFPPDGAATVCTAAVDMLSAAALNPLDSPGALGAWLHELMHGAWGPAHVTRLFNCLPGQRNFVPHASGLPQCVATLRGEVDALLGCLWMGAVPAVLDPWAGTGTIAAACAAAGVPVLLQGDIHPRSEDVVRCNSLRRDHLHALSASLPAGFIVVTSPWFMFNDLAIPLPLELLADGAAAVCVHVTGHYISGYLHAPRMSWLQSIPSGLLHVLFTAAPGLVGVNATWLCFFRDAAARRRLLRPPPALASVSWAVAHP
jgi:hypothetical protein